MANNKLKKYGKMVIKFITGGGVKGALEKEGALRHTPRKGVAHKVISSFLRDMGMK